MSHPHFKLRLGFSRKIEYSTSSYGTYYRQSVCIILLKAVMNEKMKKWDMQFHNIPSASVPSNTLVFPLISILKANGLECTSLARETSQVEILSWFMLIQSEPSGSEPIWRIFIEFRVAGCLVQRGCGENPNNFKFMKNELAYVHEK